MEALRAAVRAHLSLGLVIVSLIAELLLVVLLGYGLFRAVDLLP